jgi:hypothetical protein
VVVSSISSSMPRLVRPFPDDPCPEKLSGTGR